MSIIKKLYKHGHLSLGQEFATNTHYEVLCGSVAYNCHNQDSSDMDVHSITIPPVEMIFPWTVEGGWIPGYGDMPPKFDHFQQHHIKAFEKDYDVAIYSIVKFFDLSADNNPNMLDMLWVPEHCILHIDDIGHTIRKNRKNFLHKGSFHRFRGYSHQQWKRLENSTRTDLIERFGYDTKALYHVIRLILQCEQILEQHDMDFSANSDFLKSIRNGVMTLDEAKDWYKRKEEYLDRLYTESTLRHKPDRDFLKKILLSCLEIKYGSLSNILKVSESENSRKLEEIKRIINS